MKKQHKKIHPGNIFSGKRLNNLKILFDEDLSYVIGGNDEGPYDPPPDPDPIGAHRK